MNAKVLIDALTQACQEADVALEDIEVRIAHQPSWPFEYSISEYTDIKVADPVGDVYVVPQPDGWVIEDNSEDEPKCKLGPFDTREEAEEAIVNERNSRTEPLAIYLAEGNQIGYLPSHARQAIGW